MNNFCGTDYGHVCRHLILLGCAGHTLFSKIMAESKFFAAGSSESESSDSGDEQPAVSKPATITTKWVKHWKKSQKIMYGTLATRLYLWTWNSSQLPFY